MDDLVLLHEVSLTDYKEVGKKGAYLAELYNKKYNVPPAFLINGSLFEKFVDMVGIKSTISNILNANISDADKSAQIQKIISNVEFPKEFGNFLYENYLALNIDPNESASSLVNDGREPYVALRVSSTSEHVKDVFFLNVRGKERFLNGLKACWASVFSETNLKFKRFKPSIIVQKMTNSKKSGFIYTVNPETGNPNEMVINLCSGLGNGLSTANITPSKYVINKSDLNVIRSDLVEQVIQFNLDMSQEKTVKINLDEPIKNIIDDFFVKEISKLSKQIENRFKKPQKITFAIDKQLYLLGSKDLNVAEQMQEEVPNVAEMNAACDVESISELNNEQPIQNNGYDQAQAESLDPALNIENNVLAQDALRLVNDLQSTNGVEFDKTGNVDSGASLSLKEQFNAVDQNQSLNLEGNSIDSFISNNDSNQTPVVGDNPEASNMETPSITEVENSSQSEVSSESVTETTSTEEASSFMKDFVNNKSGLTYQKSISYNSSMLVVSCDMALLHALKNKYRSVFNKEAHNYFNELVNELKLVVNVPYEADLKTVRKLRDNFLNEFIELTPSEVGFVLETTQKFINEF